MSFGSCPWPNETSYLDLTSALTASAKNELLLKVLVVAFVTGLSAWMVRNSDLGRSCASKLVPCLQTAAAFLLLGGLMTLVLGLPLGQSFSLLLSLAVSSRASAPDHPLHPCCRCSIPGLSSDLILCWIFYQPAWQPGDMSGGYQFYATSMAW